MAGRVVEESLPHMHSVMAVVDRVEQDQMALDTGKGVH